MKVTVCQLSNDLIQLKEDWEGLVEHCRTHKSELILLPEMPFHPWIASEPKVDENAKKQAIEIHQEWIQRLDEFGDAIVAYTKPEIKEGKFLNAAYVWSKKSGHRRVHSKYFFPEEEEFYEETWFDREEKSFEIIEFEGIKIGFLLCTEVWFTQYARKYGLDGAEFLLVPRASGKSSIEQWVRCGQTSAVIGGCYCLSANRSGVSTNGFEWGGTGWIAQPGDGKLLGKTNEKSPFITIEVDLEKVKAAKKDYPLYVRE